MNLQIRRKFDKGYYQHFYGNRLPRVQHREEIGRLADFVCFYLKYLGQPVTHVLDMGCGFGLWKPHLKRHFPSVKYTGVEYSAYLCDRFHWERGSVTSYRAARRYSLVICQGVLQYLDDGKAKAAIRNLAGLCCGALYFEVLTRIDWEKACDKAKTDRRVYLREGNWYKIHLARHFRNCGGGVFLARGEETILYEMEEAL